MTRKRGEKKDPAAGSGRIFQTSKKTAGGGGAGSFFGVPDMGDMGKRRKLFQGFGQVFGFDPAEGPVVPDAGPGVAGVDDPDDGSALELVQEP